MFKSSKSLELSRVSMRRNSIVLGGKSKLRLSPNTLSVLVDSVIHPTDFADEQTFFKHVEARFQECFRICYAYHVEATTK